MNKKHSLNLGGLVCLIAAVFFICYLLREGDIFPISIDFVWLHISHWAKHFRILAVGLLPIYVALMVFGTAIVGTYFGSALQRLIAHFLCHKRS